MNFSKKIISLALTFVMVFSISVFTYAQETEIPIAQQESTEFQNPEIRGASLTYLSGTKETVSINCGSIGSAIIGGTVRITVSNLHRDKPFEFDTSFLSFKDYTWTYVGWTSAEIIDYYKIANGNKVKIEFEGLTKLENNYDK